MMRFLDHPVGPSAKEAWPLSRRRVEIQDNLGRYRTEEAWPPADTTTVWNDLNTGTYADDNRNRAVGTAAQTGRGVWSISQPLTHTAWLAGEPVLKVVVEAPAPRTNLVGLLYDIRSEGTADLITRGAYVLLDQGEQLATFDLYAQDWVLQPGHRIGVLLTGSDTSWWTHVPTFTTVEVKSASAGLPFLTLDRKHFLAAGSTPRLQRFRGETMPVSEETVAANEREFRLPPPLRPRPLSGRRSPVR